MGFKHAAKLMVQSAWCGWYLAVRDGTIAAGETFSVVPGPREVGIAELFRPLPCLLLQKHSFVILRAHWLATLRPCADHSSPPTERTS